MTMDEFLRSMGGGEPQGAEHGDCGEFAGANVSRMNMRDVLKLEIGLRTAKKMVQTIQFQMIEHFGEDDGQPERVAGDCMIAVEAIQKVLDDVVAPMLQLVRNATVDEMERRRKEEADGDK